VSPLRYDMTDQIIATTRLSMRTLENSLFFPHLKLLPNGQRTTTTVND
jgi:hypothetical protein